MSHEKKIHRHFFWVEEKGDSWQCLADLTRAACLRGDNLPPCKDQTRTMSTVLALSSKITPWSFRAQGEVSPSPKQEKWQGVFLRLGKCSPFLRDPTDTREKAAAPCRACDGPQVGREAPEWEWQVAGRCPGHGSELRIAAPWKPHMSQERSSVPP